MCVCICIQLHLCISGQPGSFYQCTFFSSYLGSCVALGHAICDCIVFPITSPILRPQEQLDGVRSKADPVTPQQRPACLEYQQLSSTNTGSTSPNLSSVPPQPLNVPQSGLSWQQGPLHHTGLARSSLPLLGLFWNSHGLLAATQPTWQETSVLD